MAKGKKSFILYSDLIDTVSQLPDDKAGELFKHILSYVNDKNPQTDDLLVNVAFGPIKAQLKRDLERWEGIKDSRSRAGKASAEARKNKNEQNEQVLTSVKSVQQSSTNSTVNVNVNDTVTVNDNVNVNVNKNKGVVMPFESSDFLEHWNWWKEYKKDEHKFKYKSRVSEQAALKKLVETGRDEATCKKIIMQSIENGWKGFFKIKQDEQRTQKRGVSQDELESVLRKAYG